MVEFAVCQGVRAKSGTVWYVRIACPKLRHPHVQVAKLTVVIAHWFPKIWSSHRFGCQGWKLAVGDTGGAGRVRQKGWSLQAPKLEEEKRVPQT